jgi:hypothetical protein
MTGVTVRDQADDWRRAAAAFFSNPTKKVGFSYTKTKV